MFQNGQKTSCLGSKQSIHHYLLGFLFSKRVCYLFALLGLGLCLGGDAFASPKASEFGVIRQHNPGMSCFKGYATAFVTPLAVAPSLIVLPVNLWILSKKKRSLGWAITGIATGTIGAAFQAFAWSSYLGTSNCSPSALVNGVNVGAMVIHVTTLILGILNLLLLPKEHTKKKIFLKSSKGSNLISSKAKRRPNRSSVGVQVLLQLR